MAEEYSPPAEGQFFACWYWDYLPWHTSEPYSTYEEALAEAEQCAKADPNQKVCVVEVRKVVA